MQEAQGSAQQSRCILGSAMSNEGLRIIVGYLVNIGFAYIHDIYMTVPTCARDQRTTKLPALLQVYLLQVMYVTFHYLTVCV